MIRRQFAALLLLFALLVPTVAFAQQRLSALSKSLGDKSYLDWIGAVTR